MTTRQVGSTRAGGAGGRYRIDALLGRGGMGAVYAVTDAVSGSRLALKRLHDRKGRNDARLHREYALLAELSHPSIIRVYEYGVDAEGPFYTMELLEGKNLSERAPLHWREACRLLRDVASSLAVLHARKLLHRDVTLRNLHCTREGRCKLLDFGAVTPTSVSASRVGTPPYLPPEAFGDRPLDGRADLFALGAALYFLLTGEHAYPANSFAELHAAWSVAPRFPHERVREVPLAVSQLTMALLSLDPLARPHSAAEVMERLSVLSGMDLHETGEARRAFLATPVLVGRALAMQQLRFFLSQPTELRPDVLLIRGPSGAGRTRMLEVCATEAQRAGLMTLSARGADPQNAYGLLRALASLALHSLPDGRDALGPLVGALGTDATRRELHAAAIGCFRALSERHRLLIGVDDLDRADEPSVACLTALREALPGERVLIAASIASDHAAHAQAAVDWLCRGATRLELQSLTRSQVLELLTSVFGDVPHVAALADRIHAVSSGQPRWVMELAEHLLDRGTVRYEAGAFMVPARFRVDELPSTLQAVLQARLAVLSEAARDLAVGFLLEPDFWYSPAELSMACELPAAQIELLLGELVARDVLVRDGERVGLKHRVPLGDAANARWHLRLARIFEAREDAMRAAVHRWAAGEGETALGVLLAYFEAVDVAISADPSELDRALARMPPHFLELLDQAIDTCVERQHPKRSELKLRFWCLRVAAVTCDGRGLAHVRPLLDHLRVEAGLEAWDRLAEVADPEERTQRALAAAQERYERASARERAFPVHEALRVLAAVHGHAAGLCSQTRDYALFASLPSLGPYVALSPTLAMSRKVVETSAHAIAGRWQQATAGYHDILDALEHGVGTHAYAAARRFNRFGSIYPLGQLTAERGQVVALAWADKLENELLFEVSAWRVRMSYYRAHGDLAELERCRRQAELLRIAHRPYEQFGIGVLATDLFHCIAWEDLIGIKRVRDDLEAVVARFPNWRPVLEIARGEYARLLAEPGAGLAHFTAAVGGCTPGRDGMWQIAAATCLSAHLDLGLLERGRELGRAWLEMVEREDLRDSASPIIQRMAVIEARLGNSEQAIAYSEQALRWLDELDITGTRAGLAHETRARVALWLSDGERFERHLAECARWFRTGKCPALWARYERLVRDACAAGIRAPLSAAPTEPKTYDLGELRARLSRCAGAQQRATSLLELFASESAATGGALYVADGGRLQLRAVCGSGYFRPELGFEPTIAASVTRSSDCTLESPPPLAADAHRSYLLLHQLEGETVVLGVAVLLGSAEPLSNRALELPSLCAQLLLEAGDATPAALRC